MFCGRVSVEFWQRLFIRQTNWFTGERGIVSPICCLSCSINKRDVFLVCPLHQLSKMSKGKGPPTQKPLAEKSSLELEAGRSGPTRWQNVDWLLSLTVIDDMSNRHCGSPRWTKTLYGLATCFFSLYHRTPCLLFITRSTCRHFYFISQPSYSPWQKPPVFHSQIKARSEETRESHAQLGVTWNVLRSHGLERLHQPPKISWMRDEIMWRFLQRD